MVREGLHGRDLIADPASGYAHIEDWGWDYRPPGGESPAELRARLEPYLVPDAILAMPSDEAALPKPSRARLAARLAAGERFESLV